MAKQIINLGDSSELFLNKTNGNFSELYIAKDTIPTTTNQLTNNSGFITQTAISTHNTSQTSHPDIRTLISNIEVGGGDVSVGTVTTNTVQSGIPANVNITKTDGKLDFDFDIPEGRVIDSGELIPFIAPTGTNIVVNGFPETPTMLGSGIQAGTGAIVQSLTYHLTDFYPVIGGKTLYLSIADGFTRVSDIIGMFDADKNPIGRHDGNIRTNPWTSTMVLPENCAYLVFYHSRIDQTEIYGMRAVYDNTITSDFDVEGDKTYNPIQFPDQYVPINEIDDRITSIENKVLENRHLERPSSGVVNFSVSVDTTIADVSSNSLASQHTPSIKTDWGILLLPTNYSPSGKPTRMIISCHATGTFIGSTSTITSGSPNFLLSQGFAVMDMNGVPGNTSDDGSKHFGSPIALRCYLAGYNYVINNYNIHPEVFVSGISMGGLASMQLSLSGSIPVIAQGDFAPCIDLYLQAFINPWSGAAQRRSICEQFGFSGTLPTFTATKPPTQPEIDYFKSNIDKVIGYQSMWKNVYNLDVDDIMSIIPPIEDQYSTAEQEVFDKYNRLHPVPIKIWHTVDDDIVRFRYSKYFIEMARRSGCLAQLRSFPSGGHNAWTAGNVVTGIPTITGGTTSVYAAYYELVNWFRLFDNH